MEVSPRTILLHQSERPGTIQFKSVVAICQAYLGFETILSFLQTDELMGLMSSTTMPQQT